MEDKVNNDRLQFDRGIMRLSAYDPSSNQYETRILTLPELPLLESLEHLFTKSSNEVIKVDHLKPLRMTKSCNNKKSSSRSISQDTSSSNTVPRRCQSNPNLKKSMNLRSSGSLRSKRTLSSAFHAVAGFIQKANKKIRSQQQQQQQQQHQQHQQQREQEQEDQQEPHLHQLQQQWPAETWLDEIRVSSDSSISSLDLLCPYYSKMTSRQQLAGTSTRENWWTSSPPINSY